MMWHGNIMLGTDGHLTKSDENMIHAHFACIIKILAHAGMDRVHIFEYVMSLGHAWWMSNL